MEITEYYCDNHVIVLIGVLRSAMQLPVQSASGNNDDDEGDRNPSNKEVLV